MINRRTVKDWVSLAENTRLSKGDSASIEIFEYAVNTNESQKLWKAYAAYSEKFYGLEQAKAVYKRAYEKYKDKYMFISKYSDFLFKIGETNESLILLQRGVSLFPGLTSFHLKMANIYEKKGDLPLAKKEYESVLKNSPNNHFAWKGIANIEGILSKIKIDSNSGKNVKIERFIQFPPECYQAGVSILTYFNTILNQRYPDIDASVTIKQDDLFVTMIIETIDGEKEIIEKAFTEYGLVVTGQMNPSEILNNSHQIIALENKLELARTELKMAYKLLESERSINSGRIDFMELEIEKLYILLNESFSANTNLQKILESNLSMTNKSSEKSFKLIYELISKGAVESDKSEVLDALNVINKNEPGVMGRIYDLVFAGAISGASGNMLYSWIVAFCQAMPR